MDIHFILIEPAVPENIGSAARAIKTMGFSSLRLVKPANHLSNEAKWLAHASNDILENAKVFDDYNDAIKDIDFLIASTAKQRSSKINYIDLKDLPSEIIKKGNSISNIGVLFGREESGLTNRELSFANITTSIKMKQAYPSLNLSQAVMIYAYTLSDLCLNNTKIDSTEIANRSFKNLLNKIHYILETIDLTSNENLTSRIFERAGFLKEEDINILHSICNRLNKKLNE